MSRIYESFLIIRSIERGEPKPTLFNGENIDEIGGIFGISTYSVYIQ